MFDWGAVGKFVGGFFNRPSPEMALKLLKEEREMKRDEYKAQIDLAKIKEGEDIRRHQERMMELEISKLQQLDTSETRTRADEKASSISNGNAFGVFQSVMEKRQSCLMFPSEAKRLSDAVTNLVVLRNGSLPLLMQNSENPRNATSNKNNTTSPLKVDNKEQTTLVLSPFVKN